MSESIKEQLQLALNELDDAMSTQGHENIDEHIHGAQERIEAVMGELEGMDKVITALMDSVKTLAGVTEADLRQQVKKIEEG